MTSRFIFNLLLFFSLTGTLSAQQLTTEVFPLGYRTASELVPVLRPVVSPDGSISGISGQLVVTATPAQMQEVRRLLATLDKAPARLLITVRRDRSEHIEHDSASVQARTDNVSISHGGVIVGEGDATGGIGSESVSVDVKSDRSREQREVVQRVQVIEGREAYISIGEEIPVRNRGISTGPGGVYRYDSTEYYPAVTGVYAITRLKGENVFVDLSTTSRERTGKGIIRTGREDRKFYRQSGHPVSRADLSTTVTGKLGEWIAIGAVDQVGNSTQDGILATKKMLSESMYGMYIKVEKVQVRK
jgi:hypothetical protein